MAGGVDYFSKPFDPEILKMKVGIYAAFREKKDVLRQREFHIRETEEILKAGRKLSAILESLPVGVLISDVQGRICQTNSEVARICEVEEHIERDSYGEILGWWDGRGQMIKEDGGPLARALLKGESAHNEIIQIQTAEGTNKTLVASASPLLGLDDKIVGAVVVVQDVTESKRIEEDFEQRIAKLVSLSVDLEKSIRH